MRGHGVLLVVSVGVCSLLESCRPLEGTESTAPEHDQSAAREDAEAAAHQAMVGTDDAADAHQRAAQRHREAAALHRDRADALQAAEARVCVGITDAERAASPIDRPEEIRSIEPIHVFTQSGNQRVARLAGASIVVLARPGVTAEWLQRLLDCHLAHLAAGGPDAVQMHGCPLALPNVSVDVESVGDGFAVDIIARDAKTAALVLARAEAILGTGAEAKHARDASVEAR